MKINKLLESKGVDVIRKLTDAGYTSEQAWDKFQKETGLNPYDPANKEAVHQWVGEFADKVYNIKKSFYTPIKEDTSYEWKPNTSFKHIKDIYNKVKANDYQFANNEHEEFMKAVDKAHSRGYKPEECRQIKDWWMDVRKNTKKNEGYSHFEFTSGSNPYIAKTKDEAERIKRSRGDSVKYVGNINGIDYYKVDDSETESDLFKFDESKQLNETEYGKDELWNQINNNEWAYNSLANKVKTGIENGTPKERIVYIVRNAIASMKDAFGRCPTTQAERLELARDFVEDELQGYSFEDGDPNVLSYKRTGTWSKLGEAFKPSNSGIQSVKCYNPYNYTIQELRVDNDNKTFERGNFTAGKADKKTKNRQEYEDIVDTLKELGYTEIKSDYRSMRNKSRKGTPTSVEEGYELSPRIDYNPNHLRDDEGKIMADRWYASKWPDDEVGIEQLKGITLDDALKDRSILGHCDTQVRERVYAQLDRYIPLSVDSPMYKEKKESKSIKEARRKASDPKQIEKAEKSMFDSLMNGAYNTEWMIQDARMIYGISYDEAVEAFRNAHNKYMIMSGELDESKESINESDNTHFDDDVDDLSYYYSEEDIIDALNDVWEEIASKSVSDSDGFMTDYTMYRNINTGEYVFVFGDKDIYRPEDGYFDWECETEEEAKEWFDNYNGFDESDDDTDWMNEEVEGESPIIHKKGDGSYLVASDSGDGYTAFNKDDVCMGHITANNEQEAKNKFNSNQFDKDTDK